MIDALIQYLLEEIAMDGDEGTSIPHLTDFVTEFYLQRPAHPSPAATQVVDHHFVQFVLTTLVEQPDIRLGLLKSLSRPDPPGPLPSEPAPSSTPLARSEPEHASPAEAQDEKSGSKPDKKPPRKQPAPSTSTTQTSTAPTHELVLLPLSTSADSLRDLLATATNVQSSTAADRGELRVLVSNPATIWKAITLSHSKPTSITPMVWRVLQHVSRQRTEGSTVVRLSRELEVDPKSMFHYIKIMVALGIVKKFTAIDHGMRTNRILHTRYLATSPHWQVHIASDPNHADDEDGHRRNDSDHDESFAAGGQMSTISALYLSTNPRLIRNRIIRALKLRGKENRSKGTSHAADAPLQLDEDDEPNATKNKANKGKGKAKQDPDNAQEGYWDSCWMLQIEMASSIGLHSYSPVILRRLNAIIQTLHNQGVLEKFIITKKNRKWSGQKKGEVEKTTTVQALKLLDPEIARSKSLEGGEQSHSGRVAGEEEDDPDDLSYPLADKSMQRQILDLLLEADTRGLTTFEISEALGHYNLRTIDTILQRLGRQTVPVEWFDHSTTSVTETIGRMKQTRWFSLKGYVAMRIERGVPDPKLGEQWEAGTKAYEDWKELRNRDEEKGVQPQQWEDCADRRKWLSRFRTMDHVGQGKTDTAPKTTGKKKKQQTTTSTKPKAPKKQQKEPTKKSVKSDDQKGKGKAKATNPHDIAKQSKDAIVNEQEQEAEAAEEDVGEDSEPEPIAPRKRGRPRKHPIIEGQENWYQRKKRLAAERMAQGLEPEESYYARKKRLEQENREREEQGLPPLKLERSGRKRRASAAATDVAGEDDGESFDQLADDKSDTSTPAPRVTRKRGRPSTLDRLAAAALAIEGAEEQDTPPGDASSETPAQEGEKVEERPKKRMRFSAAALESEASRASKGTTTVAPTVAPRRGRSSGPPLVPGPELDGAPVRPPARATIAPSPSPEAAPPPTSLSISPRRRKSTARVEAHPSGSSASKKTKGAVAVRQIKMEQSSPLISGSLALPDTLSSFPASSTQNPVLHSTDTDMLDNPDDNAGTLPTSLTIPPEREAVESSNKKRSNKTRKTVTSKDNLTALSRQKEILDFIAANAGIVDAVPRLGEYIRAFAQEANAAAPAYTMDRLVIQSALGTLVKRDQLRKTSVVGPKGNRHDIYYLPSIKLDDPAMIAFLDKTVNKQKPAHIWTRLNRAENIVLDDLSQDNGGTGTTIEGQGGLEPSQVEITASQMPQPHMQDIEEIKDYFRLQPTVIGASYGCRYGMFSRARQLHKWLASFVFSNPSSEYLARSTTEGAILTHATLVAAMPLVVFTSIVPLPFESDELREYLKDPANLFKPLSAIPPRIHAIIRPSFNKRKQAVWDTISTLITLKLLVPLCESAGDRDKPFVEPVRAKAATHWRLNSTVPVYAFVEAQVPLVAVAHLDSMDSVTEFWANLQRSSTVAASLPDQDRPDPSSLAAEYRFPERFEGNKAFMLRVRLKSKWEDGYHLGPDQRTFLSELVRLDPDLVDGQNDRMDEIAKYADALLAPVDVVSDYLHMEHKRALFAIEVAMRPKRPKRRKVNDQGDEEVEWEDVEQEGANVADQDRANAQSALHRKVQELAAQRRRDWKTIVDKFIAEHESPKLDSDVLAYLERRFLDPRKQIDAVQLLFELRQLLPNPTVQPGDENLRTTLPLILRRRVRHAQDPYAIMREPTIRRRVRAQGAQSFLPRRQSTSDQRSPYSNTYGDQNEFLSVPAVPRPDAEIGKRVRNYYTHEQDDLLLDAVAVLKARARRLDTRISYKALEHLFKGHKGGILRSRSLVLLKKPEEQAYFDRLVDAWLEVYEQRKDSDENLEDENPDSMSEFDLAAFVRCLRQNVDKRAVRLTRTVVKAPPPSLILPASLAALDTGYSVKPVTSSTYKLPSRWDYYWAGSNTATNPEREGLVAQASIATTWKVDSGLGVIEDELLREKNLTAAAIKMIISTSEASYAEEKGHTVLKPFMKHVDDAALGLREQRVIVSASSEEGRRVPGRNYSLDDKYLDRLDSTRITLERLSDASHFEKDVEKIEKGDGEGGTIFPIIPNEGEIMALIDLVSAGKIDLSIDTSTLSEKTTRFDFFRTRQANDDDIECTVQIDSVSSLSEREAVSASSATLPVAPPLLPDGLILEPSVIAETSDCAENSLHASDLEKQILELITNLGNKDGLTLNQITKRLPDCSRPIVLQTLARLLRGTPRPVILEGGINSIFPSYVIALHVAAHAIPLLQDSITIDESSKWITPCCWNGIDGQVDQALWTRATSFVRGLLWKRSQLTLSELIRQSMQLSLHDKNPYPLLTPLEFRTILTTLEKHGIVERQSGQKNPVTLIDWEYERWSLKGVFWSLGTPSAGDS
ncbi:uncharacterized protein JCM15063_006281 [Sporobolomyces koalae]|uniref:uncharacterized protein n=1 Tax=Sporobolomyces koalae TaxID=500713 RepID=UPI00317C1215